MGAADERRLAPVTWLFGAPPQPVEEQQSSAAPEPQDPERESTAAALAELRPLLAEATARARESNGRKEGRFDRVSNVSMHALARRGMSSHEMRDLLSSREFEQPVIDEEIMRLEGVGLLDDDELAKTLVRTLRERKALGKTAIVSELRRRRLGNASIEGALGELDDDELQLAVDIAIKRAPQVRSLDSQTANRRLSAFLMRKGYSGSVVSTAVARALSTPDSTSRQGPVFR